MRTIPTGFRNLVYPKPSTSGRSGTKAPCVSVGVLGQRHKPQ